jgi:ribosomal protein S20
MPNIKQQEKRVRQAARQRQENLRWRSTSKTMSMAALPTLFMVIAENQ